MPDNEIITLVKSFAFLALYLLPSMIAWDRKHVNKSSIIIINIFLGWTFIGWVVALAWGVTAKKKSKDNA